MSTETKAPKVRTNKINKTYDISPVLPDKQQAVMHALRQNYRQWFEITRRYRPDDKLEEKLLSADVMIESRGNDTLRMHVKASHQTVMKWSYVKCRKYLLEEQHLKKVTVKEVKDAKPEAKSEAKEQPSQEEVKHEPQEDEEIPEEVEPEPEPEPVQEPHVQHPPPPTVPKILDQTPKVREIPTLPNVDVKAIMANFEPPKPTPKKPQPKKPAPKKPQPKKPAAAPETPAPQPAPQVPLQKGRKLLQSRFSKS